MTYIIPISVEEMLEIRAFFLLPVVVCGEAF